MNRRKLPERRHAETIEFQHATGASALKYIGTVGRFATGELAEIFLNCRKSDTLADINARDGAIAASLALQYGCPLETLSHAMARKPDGEAMGPLGHLLDLAQGT